MPRDAGPGAGANMGDAASTGAGADLWTRALIAGKVFSSKETPNMLQKVQHFRTVTATI